MQLDPLTKAYVEGHPKDAANITFHPRQVAFGCLLICAAVALLFYRWDWLLFGVNMLLALAYFAVAIFRSVCCIASCIGLGEIKITDRDARSIPEEYLPVYTILVPLYKEANIASKIIRNVNALEYPHEKLDVKLLLEEDDDETLAAVRALELPDCFDVIIAPQGQPKTKPRACNYGLERAKGEFCVIFDAEDRPDPLQLRKVVLGFRRQKENVACIQAKLNYYNASQNWLTCFFAVEYSTTFDLLLPGLQVMRVPVPLGGTSNHFQTHILRELGGWDPFNVTEDCDLGVRIYKKGYRTRMIDSTTWEEANSDLWNWIRQRSRWVKGFFQTHLAHMRHPVRTFCQLGPWGFFGFILTVGGSSLVVVLNLIYWCVGGLYLTLLGTGMSSGVPMWDLIASQETKEVAVPALIHIKGYAIKVWPLLYLGEKQDPLWSTLSVIFFVITCVLILANLLFIAMHVAACIKRRMFWLIPAAILMPVYWALISIGAWKGLWQLFTKPFYWEKTIHGLDHD